MSDYEKNIQNTYSDLLPILVEIIMWSAKYDKNSAVEKEFVKSYNKDRETLLRQISKRLLNELGGS